MFQLTRREILHGVLAGSSAFVAQNSSANAPVGLAAGRPWRTIDTNLHLFQWPCRRLPLDTLAELIPKLDALQIDQAWAGSFEAILHRDIEGVNQRLAEACTKLGDGRLLPFGAINPTLPDWEEDVRRCHEVHRMRGIRLYPNYHAYELDSPWLERLLKMTVERSLLLQVCVSLEDRRTQHPKLQVADVAIDPLAACLERVPGAKVHVLNYKPSGARWTQLAHVPGLYFDTARIEGTDGFAKFIRALPAGRVVWGSHTPFFIYESGLIKAFESDLSDNELDELFFQNATRLLLS